MFKRLRQFLSFIRPLRGIRYLFHALGNWRRGRFRDLDYILLTLPQTMPALPEERPWLQQRIFGKPRLSLLELDTLFEKIGTDPRPKGLIIQLRGLQMALADLQSLRSSVIRLRKQGKRVVFYAQGYDNATYYVASAGDEVILQPGGSVELLGLVMQPTFLKNTLDVVGVQMDAVAISPFKGALDALTREHISVEGQAQLDWLLDSRYEMILEGIAEGRCMSIADVKAMIDHAPHLDTVALEAGYVDAVLNEEQLGKHLEAEHLVPLQKAGPLLRKRWRRHSSKFVAVLPLSGMIIQGESGRPPGEIPIPLPVLGEDRLGDLTVVRQVRHLMEDREAAAVVLWVDSPGGSAAASEAMTAALDELAKDRPVVVYMNGVAASGGYYVATPARWIVAQPGTITGSIGVILGKPVTSGLYGNARINRMEFTRGANATLYSDSHPFDEHQREQMRAGIEHIYSQFVTRVAASRRMTAEAVDAVGGGRVWTGRQALKNGLVDELGDLQVALVKARELADLPADVPFRILRGEDKPLAPQVAEQVNPAAWLRYVQDNFKSMANGRAQLLMPVHWE